MGGCLVFQSVLILWLVRSAHTGGYGAGLSALPNGHETHFNGRRVHNGGGAARTLRPTKGVGSPMGAQNGYAGYRNSKGAGYGGAAGMAADVGTKGYIAGRFQGMWPQGYGRHSGPTSKHPMKGNGYRAHVGAFAGRGNKGYGGPAAGPQTGIKGQMKGYGRATGALAGNGVEPNGHAYSGLANQGYGYGAKAGLPNGAGNNGLGSAGRKPVKGYGQPYYGAGAGLGVPQLARNQGKGAPYNGYGTQPMGGYTGGHGSAGMSLGPRYGSGGIKGPKSGYGYPNSGTNYPVKPEYGNIPHGNGGVKTNGYGVNRGGYAAGLVPSGAKPNGYGNAGTKGYGTKPNGPGNGAALGGAGNKLNGYGGGGPGSPPQASKGVGPTSPLQGFGGAVALPNHAAKAPNSGFGHTPYGKGPKMPGAPNGKGLKGGVLSPRQPSSTLQEGASPQRPIIEGGTLPAPEPTSGRLVLVTKDQYQKLPLPVPQGKNFMQPQATPAYVPKEPKLGPESSPGSALMRPLDKSLTPRSYEAGPHNNPAGGRPVAPPQENGAGASISKGHRPQAGKPDKCTFLVDCGPGSPNGQWMKIPRPGAGVSAGSNTKGYGAAGPNRLGANSGSGPAGYAGPNTGYGVGKPQQSIYRPGANLGGAAYVKGSAYPGYPNGDVAGVQPNYANLGHGVPTIGAKSGGAVQVPYNGAPAGVDDANQPEPQPAGLGPNGKQPPVYAGMEGLPYGGQLGMGPEKANAKYGIGGLQFGGGLQPANNGGDTAEMGGVAPGQYGYGGITDIGHLLRLGSNGPLAGKYGYGRMPHEVQPVGFVPQMRSPGATQYGHGALPYHSGLLGYGPNMNYGGVDGSYGSQGLGGEGKPAGKHVDNLPLHQSQPLEAPSDSRSGSPYEPQPGTAENTNAGGDPNLSRAGDGIANNKYENVGYISGSKLQPEVISLPAAPTPSPPDSVFTPAQTDDLSSDLTGTGNLAFNSEADRQATAQGSEQPDDPAPMPRQLNIQQHLKLQFHPQGSKNAKYDLNGFFGNGGYQGKS
ncbi:calymmin isoform X2 [Hippocampus comes]|uniref:calymmin isoform X2 n=1 Tax=Hippocampus comes TaxID=109280 RepID=UPI00094EAC71|nr:PREDICTED: uncharacterized PE-PGRS family protein PE_PGRS54-like isoform X2 [Hippocampus comes]